MYELKKKITNELINESIAKVSKVFSMLILLCIAVFLFSPISWALGSFELFWKISVCSISAGASLFILYVIIRGCMYASITDMLNKEEGKFTKSFQERLAEKIEQAKDKRDLN